MKMVLDNEPKGDDKARSRRIYAMSETHICRGETINDSASDLQGDPQCWPVGDAGNG